MKSDHLTAATSAAHLSDSSCTLINKKGNVCRGLWVEGFTRRLPGSPSVMAPSQTKASGVALEDQETRASVRQTHATSKITMVSRDSQRSSLDRHEACWRAQRGDCITQSSQCEPPQKENRGGAGVGGQTRKVIKSDNFTILGGLDVTQYKKVRTDCFPASDTWKCRRAIVPECIFRMWFNSRTPLGPYLEKQSRD